MGHPIANPPVGGFVTETSSARVTLITLPILADNYAYVLHYNGAYGKRTIAVDPGDADPFIAALSARGLKLDEIWLTHHHDDHTRGTVALAAATGARVRGASHDAHRLPPLDDPITPDSSFEFGSMKVDVLPADGHTLGHIAYHIEEAGVMFTGDSLMALGCGRLFEGTAEQQYETCWRLARLPGETLVCSGHEYTLSNARFAFSVDERNTALILRAANAKSSLAAGQPTVPRTLAVEQETNPFLRAHIPNVARAVNCPDQHDKLVFAALRAAKDKF